MCRDFRSNTVALCVVLLAVLSACTANQTAARRHDEPSAPPPPRLGEVFESRWRQPLYTQAAPPGYLLGDSIYLYGIDGHLIRLLRRDGGILWQSNIVYPLDGRPTRDGRGRLFAMSGGQLLVLDEVSGDRLARRRVRSGVFDTLFPSSEGLAFVGSDSSVHHIDSDTGFALIMPVRIEANPLSVDSSSDRMIHMALDDGTVAGFFSSTGQQAWRTSVHRSVFAPIGLYDETLFVGGADFYLYRIRAHTGFTDWRVPVGGMVMEQPRLSMGRVFVVNSDGTLMAVDAEDGSFLWEKGIPNCRRFLTADEKHVIFERHPNRLVLADAATGEEIGSTRSLRYTSLLAGEEDGFVCLIDAESKVECIGPATPSVTVDW